MKADFGVGGRKRPVNLTLSEDLVSQAKSMTDDLSGVVETLLSQNSSSLPCCSACDFGPGRRKAAYSRALLHAERRVLAGAVQKQKLTSLKINLQNSIFAILQI
jgi:hypothetical protein